MTGFVAESRDLLTGKLLAEAMGAEPAPISKEARIGLFERDSLLLAHLGLILALDGRSWSIWTRRLRSRPPRRRRSRRPRTLQFLAKPISQNYNPGRHYKRLLAFGEAQCRCAYTWDSKRQ